jgi:electron transfer flavoprotein beta subunit
MRIVVLWKEVPDTYEVRRLDLETGLADRAATDAVVDEIDERAMELALSHREAGEDVEVVALTMAPRSAEATVRKALAMGADSAVQIVGDALLGADLTLTAETLAAALRRIGFDLVVAGDASTDGASGMIPAMLAELLGVAQLTALDAVTIAGSTVSGSRTSDTGTVRVSAQLPAVVSITEALPAGRLVGFKGLALAKRKPVELLDASELGADPMDPGAARSIMIAIAARPDRAQGVTIQDDGDAGRRLADFLVEHGLA